MRIAATVLVLLGAAHGVRAEETQASREARWRDVAGAIFHGRKLDDGGAILTLDAPPRALDAALVPVAITVRPEVTPRTVWLIVDDNPAPVAAIVHFGPRADPHALKLRIRVDQYTLVHAVAELSDGRLVQTSRFIKAAGGCSAPGTGAGVDLARLGRMKLLPVADEGGRRGLLELLISHPNNNGMQMNPVTRLYTPARYVQSIAITQDGQSVLSMDADISIAEDPAITFGLAGAGGDLDVTAQDSAHAVFTHRFARGHQS
jgi:sulfur-oxidizing protein SoxY